MAKKSDSKSRYTQRATMKNPPDPKPAPGGEAAAPKRHVRRWVIGGVVAVLVIAYALFALFWVGILSVPGIAARYDGWNFVTEEEVTDYIELYRAQAGYEGSSDEDWATFLSDNGLTPETLRSMTIQQLVTEVLVEEAAEEEGVELADEDFEAYMDALKEAIAYGDEDIYESTLENQGVTVEEFEEMVHFSLLENELFEAMVEYPTATDTEVLYYIETYYGSGTTTKHIYYFTIDLEEDDAAVDVQWDVNQVRLELMSMGLSAENFESIVAAYCNNADVVEVGGAVGYDLDMEDFTEDFQTMVDDTDEGELSEVFADEDGYSFVYIDAVYELPEATEDFDLDAVPDQIVEYFRDCMSEIIWDDDCDAYLVELFEASNATLYSMPSGVSYDVDMDLAETEEDDSDEDEDSDEDSDADLDADSVLEEAAEEAESAVESEE